MDHGASRLKGVYLITDTVIQQRYSHRQLAGFALEAGVHMIQYRDKVAGARQALEELRVISAMTRPSATRFIINDRADLAIAGGTDGVHVGQDDLPVSAARDVVGAGLIVGGTSSTLEEALQVERDGADYVALGHIFETTTKQKKYAPLGLEVLAEVCRAVSIPVIAIGGITLENAQWVRDAGADVIALCAPICMADEPVRAASRFVELFD